MLGKAGSPVETMRDDLPTLKLDKLFTLLSIMTEWLVYTHNTGDTVRRIWDTTKLRLFSKLFCKIHEDVVSKNK